LKLTLLAVQNVKASRNQGKHRKNDEKEQTERENQMLQN